MNRGAAELAAVLMVNTSLRSLIIRDNDIGLKGGTMLSSGLQQNHHLLALSCSGLNPFHPRLYATRIKSLLERNRRTATDKERPRLEERRDRLR